MQGFDTIGEIREANAERGHYFFSQDTMRFFNSRVLPTVYGRRFFVTSEQYDDSSPRLYTVRMANDEGEIETYDTFQGYATLAEAKARAEQLADKHGVPSYDRAITYAQVDGMEAGREAGKWATDGNTDADAARKIVTGYEDGDCEIMDMCPSPLSGEWADGLNGSDVLAEYGRTYDDADADDILDSFENGYAIGWWDQVLADANAIIEPEPEPEPASRVREGYPAPIAYTWDAAYHCPGCTARAFGVDDDGWIPEGAEDSEGNPIGAVAPWDEWIEPSEPLPQSLVCGTCGGIIDTIEPEPVADDDTEPEPAESTRPADDDRAGGRNTMTRAASGDRATPEPATGAACAQCGRPMNPAARMLGPVCGDCCRRNHRAAVGEP